VAETPIRGRWTITLCSVCGERINGHRHQVFPDNGPGRMHEDSRQVEVVPVPDEAAIERGAEALVAIARRWGLGDWRISGARELALMVLRAALDPDTRPETPGERHHRELHDGTLNEMPPETRHA
jgi:hypothetical protein